MVARPVATVVRVFQHLKTKCPHLLQITDPATLAVELDAFTPI